MQRFSHDTDRIQGKNTRTVAPNGAEERHIGHLSTFARQLRQDKACTPSGQSKPHSIVALAHIKQKRAFFSCCSSFRSAASQRLRLSYSSESSSSKNMMWSSFSARLINSLRVCKEKAVTSHNRSIFTMLCGLRCKLVRL